MSGEARQGPCENETKPEARQLKGPGRLVFVALGVLALGVGLAGIMLPFLPSVPLFLAALLCFAKSSARLHRWLLSTRLYKKYLGPFLHRKPMTWKTQLPMLASITVFMSLGFFIMRNVPIGQAVLGVVWLAHVVYFVWHVKCGRRA